jgi:hypothetical protein
MSESQNVDSVTTQVSPSVLRSLGTKLVLNREPFLVKGQPGVGKTDCLEWIAKDAKHDLILSHPVVSDPTDYKGLPALMKDGKHAEFIPIGDLHRALKAKKPTVFYLDDLGQAPPLTQAACMQLLLARRINDHKIPDCVTFVAATNRKEDRAGVSSILEPVKSRFITILELGVNLEDWLSWGMENDMPAALLGYVSYDPSVLTAFKATADVVNSPSPRTLAGAGRLMNMGLPHQELVPALAGAIGEGHAAGLFGFIKIGDSMPDPDMALEKPNKFVLPQGLAAQVLYLFCVSIAFRAEKANMRACITVLETMRLEYQAMAINLIVRNDESCRNTEAYIDWQSKNASTFL